jgi:hypothetical protein
MIGLNAARHVRRASVCLLGCIAQPTTRKPHGSHPVFLSHNFIRTSTTGAALKRHIRKQLAMLGSADPIPEGTCAEFLVSSDPPYKLTVYSTDGGDESSAGKKKRGQSKARETLEQQYMQTKKEVGDHVLLFQA